MYERREIMKDGSLDEWTVVVMAYLAMSEPSGLFPCLLQCFLEQRRSHLEECYIDQLVYCCHYLQAISQMRHTLLYRLFRATRILSLW